ncbi:HAD family hydrolase [Corynebacterium uberis]|uniref:HAD family hydrolase n=1 Tax=Corynebacterium TaxID=1716 RepID=UPI001D0A7B51|nr:MULTISPECIES: HAD family hydrolase [Corynebacterium]MCZ9308850.1 HAD hydrolase-like protein [Corynebacterium sp. c6VSa_13]UDL74669.1 HAD hydrolase-like protein [Corynebacterium uberis]UDL76497.1 HAD hydrolase-like protein [Corynebacterium uberis]UDL78709.1 HAD hydrolase-like protein [Corynebacterium uberis]UDL80988.1 HAD hydrolase-like protein [Corynebacterium uberis]
MNKYQLVVCDMAGTTINDRDEVYRVLRAATEREGARLSDAQFQEHMGTEKRDAITQLLRIGGIEPTQELVGQAFAWFTAELRRTYQQTPPEPLEGVAPALRRLRGAGVTVALTTGFSREITDIILAGLGWEPGAPDSVIDISVAGDEVAHGRPAPDMIERAMSIAGITDPSEVLSCGDTQADVRSAQRAGVTAVGVLTGHLSREDFAALDTAVVLESAADLPELVIG